MDIISILSNDESCIVYSSKDVRSIVTWNKSDTFRWWRPIVRQVSSNYKSGAFDANDWEELAIINRKAKTYEEAREIALTWIEGTIWG